LLVGLLLEPLRGLSRFVSRWLSLVVERCLLFFHDFSLL
jgi:phage terminase large subunit-like protein